MIDAGDIRITVSAEVSRSGHARREHHLRQFLYIDCEYGHAVSLREGLDGALLHLQGILSLLADHPVRVEYLAVGVEQDGRAGWAETHVPLLFNSPRARVPTADEMILTLGRLGSQASEVFRSWFEQAAVLQPVYSLFFATEFSTSMYLETVFLLRVQALESLHRRTSPGRLIDEARFQELLKRLRQVIGESGLERFARDTFKAKLEYINELSLRKRLKQLIERVREPLNAVFRADDAFVEQVVDDRNYRTHFDQRLSARASHGIALYDLSLKLRVLLQLTLLAQVGVPANILLELAAHGQSFQKVRRLLAAHAAP